MTGFQISLTGLVTFVFLVCFYSMLGEPVKRPAAVIAVLGLIAVPVGLIIQIWS